LVAVVVVDSWVATEEAAAALGVIALLCHMKIQVEIHLLNQR
jgi:hypothetical protein